MPPKFSRAEFSGILVVAIIKRWTEKGCAKGRSRQLKRLFADGCATDAEMQQAAGVTVTNVRARQRVHNGLILISIYE